jgi:hypothetical protein
MHRYAILYIMCDLSLNTESQIVFYSVCGGGWQDGISDQRQRKRERERERESSSVNSTFIYILVSLGRERWELPVIELTVLFSFR